jgi:hypothetical protein
MAKLKYLVIHCTDTPEHMNVTPEMIKSWHTDKKPIGRGWSRVGYSDLIMLDGTIKNLRPYDEDDKVEDFEVTNGARGYNGVSRHIAYSGGRDANSQKPKNTLNEAQLESLAEYVKEFIQNHPDAKVIGHNQINDYKKCPSFSVAFVFEITLSNLRAEGEIDEQDFMDRAKLLCSLGHTVLISNFQEYYKLVEYFSQYSKNRMGLAMGVNNLVDIFDEKYYRHLSGGILEAFGKLFFKDLKVYLYPLKDPETGEITTSDTLKVHPRMKELYKFFKYNGKVVDIEGYDPEILDIFSREVLQMINDGKDGWEDMLPERTAAMIKNHNLFGFLEKKVEKKV